MNFVFISPNFPVRYYKWAEALKDHGITVLGIGDSPLYDVHPRLLHALTEYYFVKDLSNIEDLKKACQYFQDKYGKIDYIESDNEWWLYNDSVLRKAFNVTTGFYPEDMEKIKAKSAMKECFINAGAKVMRYTLVDGPKDLDNALAFAKEVNYPVFVKPNVGVGATDSFKLSNEDEVKHFLEKDLPETYIMEEFVEGTIVSFDGICNSHSDVVFMTTDHFPTPVADIVNDALDEYYYTNPFDLPFIDMDKEAFEEIGQRVVKSFGIKKRFFHIEFFLLTKDHPGLGKKGDVVALECNMRPAGGYTPDLIDFANSVSCYQIYADVVMYDENRQDMNKEKFYAFAVSRLDVYDYVHTIDEIKENFKNNLCMSGRYPKHIASAMGDEYYYAKFKNFEDGLAFDQFVRAKKGKKVLPEASKVEETSSK